MPPALVTLLPDLPVKIQVDFQSVHHSAFQLFVTTSAGGTPALLKQGAADVSFVVARQQLAYRVEYEFIWFANPQGDDFRAALIFTQQGTVQGSVPVSGKNAGASVDGEVAFQ
jgi:hypothetical protein